MGVWEPWSSLTTQKSIHISCLPTAAGHGHLPTEKSRGKGRNVCFSLMTWQGGNISVKTEEGKDNCSHSLEM